MSVVSLLVPGVTIGMASLMVGSQNNDTNDNDGNNNAKEMAVDENNTTITIIGNGSDEEWEGVSGGYQSRRVTFTNHK